MNRYAIIKTNRNRMFKISRRLQNIKNYKSTEQMLKDVTKYENARKEIEIQEAYVQHEK